MLEAKIPRATSEKKASKRKSQKFSSADALLNAVSELFIERRSLNISLSDIAQKSRLNSALIKYYFGNKDGLLLALIERDASQSLVALNALLEMDSPADRKMRIHIAGIINSYHRTPYLNRLLHYLIGNGETAASKKIANFFVKPVVEAQRAILTQGEHEGVFRQVDAEMFYFSMVGACDHLFFATHSLQPLFGELQVTEDLRRRYTSHVTDIYMTALAKPRNESAS